MIAGGNHTLIQCGLVHNDRVNLMTLPLTDGLFVLELLARFVAAVPLAQHIEWPGPYPASNSPPDCCI